MPSPRLLLLSLVAAGCAPVGRPVGPTAPAASPVYALGCADVVGVRVADRPELSAAAAVGLDGRLPLGLPVDPVAGGRTVDELRQSIAQAAGVEPAGVTVELAAARAGRVYLVGPENRTQRAVPYIGPEPVADFLTRAGAVRPGCSELRSVEVVRPNVAVGGVPEVVRVDMAAIVNDGDHRTNVTLEPSDVVTVGETRRSCFSRQLPAWAQPGFKRLARVAGE